MTQFSTKLLKLWMLYDPCLISQPINPSMVYKGRIYHFSVRFKSSLTSDFAPTGDQSYFRFSIHSFAADSSRKMSWSGLHSAKCCIHSLLNHSFCCKARLWSYDQQDVKIDFERAVTFFRDIRPFARSQWPSKDQQRGHISHTESLSSRHDKEKVFGQEILSAPDIK